VSLVIRADTPLDDLVPAMRAAVLDIDPAQPIPELRPLDEWIAESTAQPRLTTALAGAFALAALFLTAVGIYGVVSYGVSQRTQEMGVRMAIGAARASVVGLVLREGMTWGGTGIVLGLVAAWSTSRAVASLLFGVSTDDPFTFAISAVALSAVAGLACAVPAVRATRIDPVIALRSE
jgi:ABC-type antimicrobial peptide transport system permease subunit